MEQRSRTLEFTPWSWDQSLMVVSGCASPQMQLALTKCKAVMNQWTVPLEWNGGMEYWNDP